MLNRYARLYLCFLRFSFSRAVEFRVDFFFRILMDLFYYAFDILFFKTVFTHTDLLAGWNEAEAMVFVAGTLVVDAVEMTFIANNMWWLPIFINKGELDYYLIRPASPLFILSLRDIAVNSMMNLACTAGIMTWALAGLPGELSAARLAVFFVLLAVGCYLYYLVRLMFLLPVFWTHSSRGFDPLFWILSRFMDRPDLIFTGWVRRLLITVLPFSLMVSFPARIFFGGFDPALILHITVVTLAFTGIVALSWKAGLKAYASASS